MAGGCTNEWLSGWRSCSSACGRSEGWSEQAARAESVRCGSHRHRLPSALESRRADPARQPERGHLHTGRPSPHSLGVAPVGYAEALGRMVAPPGRGGETARLDRGRTQGEWSPAAMNLREQLEARLAQVEEERRRRHIRLERALLCVECSAIFQDGITCPACGSAQLFPVARAMNREQL